MKKAQAAMDFIITYGWAIFAVFAVIGALAYFGILSPEKLKGEDCYITEPGFTCISHFVGQGRISVSLQNDRGMEVTINSIKVNECVAEFSKAIPIAEKDEFEVPCTTGALESEFKGKMEIAYTEKDTGFAKKASGILKGTVE